MWNPHFSIRATLLVIIGVLNILITALIASNLYDSWIRHGQIKMMRNNAAISNLLYNAEKHLSRERGVAMSVPYAPSETVDELFRELDESRRDTDTVFEEAINYIENETAYDIPVAIKQVEEMFAKLEAVRAEFDKLRGSQTGIRTERLIHDYFVASTDLAMEIGSLIETYTLLAANVDTQVFQQIRLKHVIWTITEYAGREYAVMGPIIATGNYPTPEVQQDLKFWKGHIELGWSAASLLVRGSGLVEQLKPYMDEAESHYFFTFEQIKDVFYDPRVKSLDAPYPIGIELWLEMATQAIESFRTMQDAVLEQNLLYINRLESEAQWNIIGSLFFFIFAFILSFYSYYVVIFRVVRPVNTMIGALYKAIQGESYEIPGDHYYPDEIGKLGTVLQVFKDQALELDDRRRYLKTVLATIPDSIITINSGGIIQMINPATEKMFGYTDHEMVGKNITMLMPEQYIDAHKSGMKHYLDTGKAKIIGTNAQLEGRRKDGEIFPLEVAITEMMQGDEHFFVGVLRDITVRKAAEEKIRQSMAELEKSNMELDDFAYIASHDLKEPLRGLHNFSGFLLEDYSDKLDDSGRDMLRTISSLTQQMEGLLNALLHYSRLGRTDLSIQFTDLNKLVADVLKIFAITIEQKNAEIIVHTLPALVCDHVRIKEVFQNLIGNALKYNDTDKPTIEIGVINDHLKNPGEQVFYVKDNGIGIDSRNLESIFKIFRRLHPHHAYGGGTGSGLTIAKKIINQHGGEIWAESEGIGKGTTFYFTIPSRENKAVLKLEH